MKSTKILYWLLIFTNLHFLTACDEHGDPQADIPLTDQQKATVSMRGVWAQPSEALLPPGTTEGVLDSLLLEFRIDDNYNPSTFSATGASYFFSADNGLWNWEGESASRIELVNVTPITRIEVMKEAATIRVTFNYEPPQGGRLSGAGVYGVTLNKIAP